MAKILMLHGVDEYGDKRFNNRFFPISLLFEYLSVLKHSFKFISIEQAFDSAYINDDNSICLSFDDGYENNYTMLRALLAELNVPAAIYVTGIGQGKTPILWADLVDIATPFLPQSLRVFSTTFERDENGKFTALKHYLKKKPVGGMPEFGELFQSILAVIPDFRKDSTIDVYWKLLESHQIELLSKDPLITIGSHGYWHNNLANIPLSSAKLEIDQSVEFLEKITKKKIETLSFPDGSYSEPVADYCIQRGINKLLGSHYVNSDKFPLDILQHRIGIYSNESIEQIQKKILA